LFVTSTPVFADVYFSSRVTYYNVYGTSEYDLNRDFKEKRLAPRINPDNTVIANTYLRFNSKLNHNGRCENSKVDVYVDITQTYPRWVDYNLGSLTLRA
jgi:predicted secreted Zn-dependent protease